MSIVQMTSDQLQELIESVRNSAAEAATDGAANVTQAVHFKGSFTNCKARFGGQRNHEAVEEFITSMVTYKEIEHISDEDALRGISLLFSGLAATWWQGVKREAKTWNEAIELIRSHFSPTKPAYQVYMEIFQSKQTEATAIDTFVCQKRALLAQLAEGRHDDDTEMDLIYGMLHINYRKHIARHDVKTFRDLLEKGRIIEHNKSEASEATSLNTLSDRGRKRCTYNNYRGPTVGKFRRMNTAEPQKLWAEGGTLNTY